MVFFSLGRKNIKNLRRGRIVLLINVSPLRSILWSNVNGNRYQRLWLTLPKSAIFLDRFAQRWGFAGTLRLPEKEASGAATFWFQIRFGLARTSGLKQNANAETFCLCFNLPRFADPGAAIGDCWNIWDTGERSRPSYSSSESGTVTGNIPRSIPWQRLRSTPAIDSSTVERLDCCLIRRPWKIVENHDDDEEDESGPCDSRWFFSNFSDLDLKSLDQSDNLVLLCFRSKEPILTNVVFALLFVL